MNRKLYKYEWFVFLLYNRERLLYLYNNSVIAPTSTYEYDALYRLTKATGREKESLSMPTHDDFENNIPCPASNAMQNYTQKYKYDALGNMLQMKSVDNWTRDYFYDTNTNYLLKHDEQQPSNDYTYDAHGNMLSMPHLSSMIWNCKDELAGAVCINSTFNSYYNYDAQGNRTRKTVVKGNVTETRYYIGGYEVFRKETSGVLDFERKTLNISDDEKVFVRVEQKIGKSEIVRYQYDNHLGSACLELDFQGDIISYEEYHAFGSTSYKSGRSETEVSQKRYRYCNKERDEESGLYYYEARYYAAWLGRFVSVDPLQFEYPELTPFQYASNRPVTCIDLDGCEAATTYSPAIDTESKPDKIQNPVKVPTIINIEAKGAWLENQSTGEIQYSSELRASDIVNNPQLLEEGWSLLGDSNLFDKVDEKFLSDNHSLFSNQRDIAHSYPIGEADGTIRRGYQLWLSPESSKNFMATQGYKSMPTQVTEYNKAGTTMREVSHGGSFTYTYGGQTIQINEKYGYFPNNYIKTSSSDITPSVYNLNTQESVIRKTLTYSALNIPAEIGKTAGKWYSTLFQFFVGRSASHNDPWPTQIHNSWDSAPKNNVLINQFRRTYGTR